MLTHVYSELVYINVYGFINTVPILCTNTFCVTVATKVNK